ncbi:MAG: UDP-N-acetylmuramate--alanine ligase [Saprospiraceae bacterium]|jgi:UDP-N-acetylmuramate--alanine ligase|tara:strand:- start:718 stop:2097 length:1380 start_codon:yes stop_codon:yes gene_type:complete
MSETNKIYFIGIGGIGMSAIARYMLSQGKEVYGYDKNETTLTKKLVDEGMKIHYTDDVNLISEGMDLVVYTPAIPKGHSELNHFIDNGYDVIKRAEMLGRLSLMKKTIAIAGTHGKTSTSATTAHLLKHGKEDVSAFIGGIMSNYNSNYIEGSGDWIVVEADEYDRSFLHLSPDIIAIMSMDADHLDIYGNHNVMIEGFEAFIMKIKQDGTLIIKEEMLAVLSDGVIEVLAEKNVNVVLFGIETNTEVSVDNVRVQDGKFFFDYQSENGSINGLQSNLAGRHNIENSTVAITIATILGMDGEAVRDGLQSFKGIKRRFETIYEDEHVTYIDDYAHHPTELRSAIGAAKELFPEKKITGIFQPHLFSRTRDFADGFAEALDMLDEVLLLDIYPAREESMEGITSKIIFDRLKMDKKTLVTKETLMDELKNRELELLMTLGAGDIDTFVAQIDNFLNVKRT